MVERWIVVLPWRNSSVWTSQSSVCRDTFSPPMWIDKRIVQPVTHPHEDVHAQLPLDFDDLQVQGLEIPRVDVRVDLVDEMALIRR